MNARREMRRLAFQALFQLDAAGDDAPEMLATLRQWAEEDEHVDDEDRERAMTIAQAAWQQRATADRELRNLAPDWPTHRLAAVDRAILRLAYYEMTATEAPPKQVINDSIELAKQFSTDRSPSFVNALLDKVLKRVLGDRPIESTSPESP